MLQLLSAEPPQRAARPPAPRAAGGVAGVGGTLEAAPAPPLDPPPPLSSAEHIAEAAGLRQGVYRFLGSTL